MRDSADHGEMSRDRTMVVLTCRGRVQRYGREVNENHAPTKDTHSKTKNSLGAAGAARPGGDLDRGDSPPSHLRFTFWPEPCDGGSRSENWSHPIIQLLRTQLLIK